MLRCLAKILDKGAEHATAARSTSPCWWRRASRPTCTRSGSKCSSLKTRIDETIRRVESTPAIAFEGADDRDIVIPLTGDLAFEMKGHQLLRDWALPHFYFHVVTAYDIVRHEGVEIGKRDYLASVGGYIRKRS
jgi:hypothetical protein